MPWVVPLVTLATSVLTKQMEAKKAQRDLNRAHQQEILDARAQELGGSPYQAMSNRYLLQNSALKRQMGDQTSMVPAAIQAFSSTQNRPKSTIDLGGGNERGAYEAFKAGASDPDDDLIDPWSTRR